MHSRFWLALSTMTSPLVGVLVMGTFCAPRTMADSISTYVYQGKPFDSVFIDPSFNTPMPLPVSVSGFFTIQTLGPSLPFQSITPTSFSFTDGYQTITDFFFSSAEFAVSTDGHGNISNWSISIGDVDISGNGGAIFSTAAGDLSAFDPDDDTVVYGASSSSRGTWNSELAVPEPSLVFLVSPILLGIAYFARKRFVRGNA